ncbi:kinase-like domain-containing protein, partial [Rhodofomes roseus]
SMLGTVQYVSLNVHNGTWPSQRDDLISLAYVLVHLAQGGLPWHTVSFDDVQKPELISLIKRSTPVHQLCEGLPLAFTLFLEYCNSLGLTDDPDYKFIKSLFMDVLESHPFKANFNWQL